MRTFLQVLVAAAVAGGLFAGVAAAGGAFERDFVSVVEATHTPQAPLPDAAVEPIQVAMMLR